MTDSITRLLILPLAMLALLMAIKLTTGMEMRTATHQTMEAVSSTTEAPLRPHA